MLRSFPRAAPSLPSIRGPSIRIALQNPQSSLPICSFQARKQRSRSLVTHAISNPTLSQIEKRWEAMPPQEQADLWMALRDRMKNDWHELTLQERKAGESACFWLSFVTFASRRSACILRLMNDTKMDLGSRLTLCVSSYSSPNSIVKNSVLDSIWSSWSSRSPSAWRELVRLQNDNVPHRHCLRSLCHHTAIRTTTAQDDECPVPRSDQRISKGTLQ